MLEQTKLGQGLITGENKADNKLFERYLEILQVSSRKPSREALDELVATHLFRIPFENVSKIYAYKRLGRRFIPSLAEYLDGIEQDHFGGTCYTNNYYMYRLLEYLGYQVKLCGADITREGAPPNGHMISMVSVDGEEVIVDVGYGAPFLRPLPRDLHGDYVITLGRDRYVLRPRNQDGRTRLELYRDGQLRHGYLAKPEALHIDQFKEVIERSYSDTAPFLNTILLARFWPTGMLALHNFQVVESSGSESRFRWLNNREEIVSSIHNLFGMPTDIVADVVQGLGEMKNLWS